MQIIAVISGKGGVGKTTFTANIGAALAGMGQKVLVLDGNLSGANLGLHLGLSNFYPFSLNNVLRGEVSLNHSIYKHPLGFDIIPASLTDIDVNPRRLKYVLADLVEKKDFIIVDAAAGIDNEVRAAVEAADKVVIVTNPEVPAVVDALRAKTLAEKNNRTVLGVVLNKSRGDKFELAEKEIEEIMEMPVIANIPYSKRVREAIALKQPVVTHSPHSSATLEINKLSHMLLGQEPPTYGFFTRLRGRFS
jgi:septum site-determining protein MinD